MDWMIYPQSNEIKSNPIRSKKFGDGINGREESVTLTISFTAKYLFIVFFRLFSAVNDYTVHDYEAGDTRILRQVQLFCIQYYLFSHLP